MKNNLKAYSDYKEFGEPWLEKVPSHWSIVRTKSLLYERSSKGFPNEPMLAATQTKGVVRKELYENRTVLALKDLHLLKLVEVGDFVISLRSFQGGIEYARERGIISPAYTILFSKNLENQPYLAKLFKSKPYIENLTLFVTGIRQGQNIDYQKLSRSGLPLPPLEEQTAIVRYLDYMDRRIKRFIRAKQKLIKLLNEQKQAIIHQAVTRGLDPNVPLKPSGVEWLGDIPANWEVIKLKYLATKFGSGVTPKGGSQIYQTQGVPFLRSQNIHFSGLRLENVAYISNAIHQKLSNTHVQTGDVLLNITGASIGRTCIVPVGFIEGNVNQHVCIIRPVVERVMSVYLSSYISTPMIQNLIYTEANGASREGLTINKIKSLDILLPPLTTQIEISDYIVNSTKINNELILKNEQNINILKEYQTRLIADVVTGKLDVRQAAAALPDELEEETLDETDMWDVGARHASPLHDELSLTPEMEEEE